MKSTLKKFYFSANRFIQTTISAVSILLFSKRGIGSKIREANKFSKSSSATILANGPSVKELVANKRFLFKDSDLLVLNNFANSVAFFELKPMFYILLDPIYFNPTYVAHSTELGKENLESIKLVQDNLKKVDWDMILFLPASNDARNAWGLYASNPHIHIVEFNPTRVIGNEKLQNWAYRNNLGVSSTYNVTIPAIQMMVNLGYKTIYLYGMEFSWTKTMDVDIETGQMYINDRHFYSRDEIRFFGRGGYAAWLLGIYTALEGVERVAKYAESMGVRVVNRTKGSFVDSFEYENPDILTQQND